MFYSVDVIICLAKVLLNPSKLNCFVLGMEKPSGIEPSFFRFIVTAFLEGFA